MRNPLITQPHFGQPGKAELNAYTPGDDFYEALIDTHRGLADADSQLLNARLILLLANHIGDLDVLRQALAAARGSLGAPAASPPPSATPSATPSAPASPPQQPPETSA